MRDPPAAGDTSHGTPPGEALHEARLAKVAELAEMGVSAWANDFAPSMSVAAFQAAFADTQAPAPDVAGAAAADASDVRLAGRLMAINRFGRAAFARLVDGAGDGLLLRQQIYLRRDQLSAADWEVFQRCDLGDIVGAAGRPMRTKTGELTLAASRFRLLTKALRPPPEKWHGLHDLEKRTRMRYLDLLANDESRRVFLGRAHILARIRAFLGGRGFVEVETPMMHAVAGGAAARPFRTHHQALGLDLFLRIAPELYLKRLLVGGLPRVFEINRNFRNEGMSPVHNPEFTMLEFYQAFSDCAGMMALTEALMGELAGEVLGPERRVTWQGHEIHLGAPFRRQSMAAAVAAAGVDAAGHPDDAAGLAAALAARGLPAVAGGAGAQLAALFEHLVEPTLVQPTFITDFPAEISPLSRRQAADPSLVDRFELFVGGRELANAFSELNDPIDQRQRFEAQRRAALAEATAAGGGADAVAAVDEDYLLALEHGMPPAGGCGIGIDRLVMLLTGRDAIRDVILFPLMRPER